MTVLDTLIAELEHDGSLHQADRLRQRLEALDRLETYLFDGRQQTHDVDSIDGSQLHDRAAAICAKLEAANGKFYEVIRSEIRQGVRPHGLLAHVRESVGDARAVRRSSGERYDYLDALISGVLQFQQPNAGVAELEPEMMFYQPTPARHIFDLIGRTALTERDVLIDLGSGLGHVPLLTSICTSARSIGIERDAASVDCARQSARGLNLSRVTFIRQDVRAANFSSGTVFYLYTLFTGAILRDVLDSLRREAASREIRLLRTVHADHRRRAVAGEHASAASGSGRHISLAQMKLCEGAEIQPAEPLHGARRQPLGYPVSGHVWFTGTVLIHTLHLIGIARCLR